MDPVSMDYEVIKYAAIENKCCKTSILATLADTEVTQAHKPLVYSPGEVVGGFVRESPWQ